VHLHIIRVGLARCVAADDVPQAGEGEATELAKALARDVLLALLLREEKLGAHHRRPDHIVGLDELEHAAARRHERERAERGAARDVVRVTLCQLQQDVHNDLVGQVEQVPGVHPAAARHGGHLAGNGG